MRNNIERILFFIVLLSAISCGKKPVHQQKQFELVSPEHSNVHFKNDVDDTTKFTIFNTYYVYNGGGVAVGDIDNDGLQDLLLSSNQNGCRLYRNLSGMQFEDITEKAGITYEDYWTTGVCMADINADGFEDIYICRSGLSTDTDRGNLVYLNNGDLTFTESSRTIGLHDQGPSNQIYFFDLDLDDDLDAYVINHPLNFENAYNTIEHVKPEADSIYSNRFYLNEGGRFTEANAQLGVDMEKGFSLSASIGDVNGDGWPDVYVANDFISPDHLYINQQGKGFVSAIDSAMTILSMLSMGSDLADVNNDGMLDLFVADMEPRTHMRRKEYDLRLDKGFYDLNKRHLKTSQFTRNMFFLGSETGFKEMARFSGISTTDWSWATLFEDLDSDGLKDLYVTNGTMRDIHNVDYIALVNDEQRANWMKRHDPSTFIKKLPINLLPNYAYKNLNGIQFGDHAQKWGLDAALNGQGCVIADLDNDGHLDIVVNNSPGVASIYRNTNLEDRHSISVKLKYRKGNMSGIGSKVTVWTGAKTQSKYLYRSRGFQSCMDDRLHFGVGSSTTIDSLEVKWPDGSYQKMKALAADTLHQISYNPDAPAANAPIDIKPLFQSQELNIAYQENDFDEFRRDRIVPFGSARSGPSMEVGDINNHGYPDLIVGGATGYTVTIYFANASGEFRKAQALEETTDYETTSLLLIDLDNDNDLDLYVGNGSNEGWGNSYHLQDQVFINNGKGNFTADLSVSANVMVNSLCLLSADFDEDGQDEIFIGGGFLPGGYGWCPGSRILKPTKSGLKDITTEICPSIGKLGPIHDAVWADLNGNGNNELIIAGHWEPIRSYEWDGRALVEQTPISNQRGMWNTLLATDVNADGRLDLLAGNLGLNTLFQASNDEPLELYTTDLDSNGTPDPIVTHYLHGERGTFVDKMEFCEKMPEFNNRFLTNRQFAETPVDEILKGKNEQLMVHLKVEQLASMLFLNEGESFTPIKLPFEAQLSPIKVLQDWDAPNGSKYILALGNSNSEFFDQGDLRNNHGLVLTYKDSGLTAVPASQTGLDLKYVVNSGLKLPTGNGSAILLGTNDGPFIQLTAKD